MRGPIVHKNNDRKPKNGFTLLEMLVALSLFSLAALSLIKLQAYTIRTTGDIEQFSMARIVIQNLAVDILTSPQAPSIGKSNGTISNAGAEWQWEREVQFTDDRRILRIDLQVKGENLPSPAVLTLVRPVEL